MNKPLSERMMESADKFADAGEGIAALYLKECATKVRALEQQAERGVEGLVPEGWVIAHIEWRGQARQPTYEADLWCHENGDWVKGSGPTIEAAIQNAAERVTK